MENNYEVNIVCSLEMDRDAEATSAESQNDSSLSNSSLESRGDADSNLDECAAAWTNEKHSSYLDSLENSFVSQLYSLLGRQETRSVSRTRPVHSDSHRSTHKVRHGCRHNGKKRAFLEMSSEYTIGNAAAAYQGNVLCKEDKAFTITYTRNSVGHVYPAHCNSAEASGQNFREEDRGKGCNSGVSRKRRREANYDESSLDDQVVP